MTDVWSGAWTYAKKKFTLSVTFEVVDDPNDDSEFRNSIKPLNVWYLRVGTETAHRPTEQGIISLLPAERR